MIDFHLSSCSVNPHPVMTFSLMRSGYYAINIYTPFTDIPFRELAGLAIRKTSLQKGFSIILTELQLPALLNIPRFYGEEAYCSFSACDPTKLSYNK